MWLWLLEIMLFSCRIALIDSFWFGTLILLVETVIDMQVWVWLVHAQFVHVVQGSYFTLVFVLTTGFYHVIWRSHVLKVGSCVILNAHIIYNFSFLAMWRNDFQSGGISPACISTTNSAHFHLRRDTACIAQPDTTTIGSIVTCDSILLLRQLWWRFLISVLDYLLKHLLSR